MASKKDRRHSGRRIDVVRDRNNLIYAVEFWDEWVDLRDGFRYNPDRSQLRDNNCMFSDNLDVVRWNRKLKKKIKIRHARKHSLRNRE